MRHPPFPQAREEILALLRDVRFGVSTIEFLDLARERGMGTETALSLLRELEAEGSLLGVSGRWIAR